MTDWDKVVPEALQRFTVYDGKWISAPVNVHSINKAGIAFLAWLNGAQSHFIMPGGFQPSREITHYAEVFRLAERARLLSRPDLAVERMTLLLRLHGID